MVWEVLKALYGAANVPNILEFHFERWATNSLHYGSFSTWPIGAERPKDARQRLAAPVERVHFAQDATDAAIGTIAGSVSAGERAAREIIACVNGKNNQCPRPYRPTSYGARPLGCGVGGNSGARIVLQPLAMILASILSFAMTSLL